MTSQGTTSLAALKLDTLTSAAVITRDGYEALEVEPVVPQPTPLQKAAAVRSVFAPAAEVIAARAVTPAAVHVFAPAKMSAFASWFTDDADSLLVAVVPPWQEFSALDEVLAHALAWQHGRKLVLVAHAADVRGLQARLAWIATPCQVFAYDQDLQPVAVQALGRDAVLAERALLAPLDRKVHRITDDHLRWIDQLVQGPSLVGIQGSAIGSILQMAGLERRMLGCPLQQDTSPIPIRTDVRGRLSLVPACLGDDLVPGQRGSLAGPEVVVVAEDLHLCRQPWQAAPGRPRRQHPRRGRLDQWWPWHPGRVTAVAWIPLVRIVGGQSSTAPSAGWGPPSAPRRRQVRQVHAAASDGDEPGVEAGGEAVGALGTGACARRVVAGPLPHPCPDDGINGRNQVGRKVDAVRELA